MYRASIEHLNALQETRLTSVALKKKRLSIGSALPTKHSGLYWIYATYTDEELLNSTPSPKTCSIDIGAMVARHAELAHVCNRRVGDFRLVYNGIGGVGPSGHGGLRERILEEFRGGEGTGSLAIVGSSLNDLEKWRFSYVLWSEIQFAQLDGYPTFSESVERLWRIHYGWPVLCTK